MVSRVFPFALIIIGIVVLVLPGVLFNNFYASNLVEPNEPSLICNGSTASLFQPDLTCHGSVNVGCLAASPAATPCALNGASVSFLNQNSPFTDLILHGDIFGFLNNLASSTAIPGPFTTIGLPSNNAIPVNCYTHYISTGAGGLFDNQPVSCTQIDGKGTNVSRSAASSLLPVLGTSNSPVPFYNLVVTNQSSYTRTQDQYYMCSTFTEVLYTIVQGGSYGLSGYLYTYCQYYVTTNHQTTYYSFVVAENTNSTAPKTNAHIFALAEPVTFLAFGCDGQYNFPQGLPPGASIPLGVPPITQGCSNLIYQASTSATSGSSTTAGSTGVVLTFVGGILLFILGLGLNFGITGDFLATGGGVDAGVNEQGTRLAQVLGLTLIGFTPLYSEFSSWFTSGYLPFGLDGSGGIVSILVVALVFMGVFWMSISIDA